MPATDDLGNCDSHLHSPVFPHLRTDLCIGWRPLDPGASDDEGTELEQINAAREANRREGFYEPIPATPRLLAIREAIAVLVDPDIPWEHVKLNHNCGECWSCISGTISLVGMMRREGRKERHDPA